MPEQRETAEKAQVIVTAHHDDLRPDDTFHEWIRDSSARMVGIDAAGRRNDRMLSRTWQRWRCNNLDCTAEALVNETWIEGLIADRDPSFGVVTRPASETDGEA